VRLSFAAAEKDLVRALERITRFLTPVQGR
jgi:hypothetical protein